jgi:hypothetical protein
MTPRVPHLAAVILITGVARADITFPHGSEGLSADVTGTSAILSSLARALALPDSDDPFNLDPELEFQPPDGIPQMSFDELMPSAMLENQQIDLSRMVDLDELLTGLQLQTTTSTLRGGPIADSPYLRGRTLGAVAASTGSGQPGAGQRPRMNGPRDEGALNPLPVGMTLLLVALPIGLILSVLGLFALASRRHEGVRLAW